MKLKLCVAFFVSLFCITSLAHANIFGSILKIMRVIEGLQGNMLKVQRGILDGQHDMVSMQRDLLKSQQEMDHVMKQVNSHLTGNSGWGTYQFHDYQSYGDTARNWTHVMQMAESGHGGGPLGQTISGMAHQFPIERDAFNRGVADSRTRQYYAVKSQTILAARAASQLDYDKIQDQIAYQQMLQQQIEKTKDLKAAMDLSNRIQMEGNLIHLEILRLAALSNQQQAITEQATVNSALSNARFLSK